MHRPKHSPESRNSITAVRLAVAALTFLTAVPAPAQNSSAPSASSSAGPIPLASILPVDPRLRIGTLPNGLRYYIRVNQQPAKRAELRLVVNAGSVLESDSQLGLAHFLEHTAFNGTTHFAGNDLVRYLQSIGVRFGADLNAYTAFDETVYILPVPTDTASIVESAFTILEDWAHGQIFDSAEVVAERGVVHEEWRGRNGAGNRMLAQWLPIAFQNSLYAKRLPIGTEASIMSATPARLRQFYRDWYRPELMAVIAVGDFDPAAIEAQITRHFSGIPRNTSAPRRESARVPDNAEPLIAIARDKEAVATNVSLIFKLPRPSTVSVADYRRDLAGQLYLQMLNARLGEITQRPDAPFLTASAARNGFLARDLKPFSLDAQVKEGGVEAGIEALLIEARRVDKMGFLQSELDRARTSLLRAYEHAYIERDKTLSSSLAGEYIRNYLEAEPVPGIEYEYRLAQQLLPTIALADVNGLAASWITDTNRVVVVQAPDKPGSPLPAAKDIAAAFARVERGSIAAYSESVSDDALIDPMPTAGKIVGARTIAGAGVTEWKLSNGARVLIKPTDFKADEILMTAYSPGGLSQASNSDFMSAALASQVVSLGGLGKFNRVELGKKMAGKAISLGASITETTEGFNGGASPRDLETLLQLMYLNFTAPRLDTGAFSAFRNRAMPSIANRGSSPDEVFKDTIQVTMAQHDPRARPITPATFAEVDPQRSLSFFRSRFGDAGDFTFVFVGNVDTTALRPLVERYLASLSSTGRVESVKVTGRGPPSGVTQRTVRKGIESKAGTLIAFLGPCTYSPQTRFEIRALADVLQLKLVDELREKLGGTYSPSVRASCSRVPRAEYAIQVEFGSSPESVETLSKATLAVIDGLKTIGPSPADVEKVKEQQIRERQTNLRQNAYWLGNISGRDQAGEDLAGLLAPYDEMVRMLTAAQIKAAAIRYLNTSNYARFVLLPETK